MLKLRDSTIFRIRPFTYDRCVLDEIFIHKVYTKHFDIREGDTVVDLDAHIGDFTVFAAKNNAFVYSYEPEPRNFALLTVNVKMNNLKTKVKTFPYAVAGKKVL
jgi:predicted RNA methylase